MIGRVFRPGQLWKNSKGTFLTVVKNHDGTTTLRKGQSMSRGRIVHMGNEAPDGWIFVAPLFSAYKSR